MFVTLPGMCHRLVMDQLAALLDGPRAERAFLLKAMFAGTWSIRIEDEAALSVVLMARGSAVFTGGSGPRDVAAGDVVVVRGPAPYTFADAPGTPEEIRILPGQVCVDPNGVLLDDSLDLGVRTWGNSRAEDATVMLIGTYERETAVGSLLLERLPREMVLAGLDLPVAGLLAQEVVRDEPGQSAVLDRLLDLLLVSVLRTALAAADPDTSDPGVAAALRAMQEHPERAWTVQSLGALGGRSRAAFARRFADQVGEPPLAHLTRWRLALAADLLAGTELTIAAIAARVGYSDAFALSAAFKRRYGVPPSRYRVAES
jgi:AraC-like DNA-binding protein